MKKLIAITILTAISAISAFAQTGAEKEILEFIADYDRSYINQDVGFLEANLAEEFTSSNPSGTIKNRAQILKEAREEFAKPTEKMLLFKSTNETVRVVGNMAIASGFWTWSGVPLTDLQAEPHTDKGRYTLVFEKRGGKWLLTNETFTEAPHDKKMLEAQVLKMGLAYNDLIVRGDASEIEKVLADEYIYTNEKGETKNKAEDLATYKNRKSKIISAETTDQKVRVIGNAAAVETGTFHVKGTGSDGKPFDETERYTTVWVWRNLRWQIVSDHTSEIKK